MKSGFFVDSSFGVKRTFADSAAYETFIGRSPIITEFYYDTTANRYRYWDGSEWVDMTPIQGSYWALQGNEDTDPGQDFIGTRDEKDLQFWTNFTPRMWILSSGEVGIGQGALPGTILNLEDDLSGESTNLRITNNNSDAGSTADISIFVAGAPQLILTASIDDGPAITFAFDGRILVGSDLAVTFLSAGVLRFEEFDSIVRRDNSDDDSVAAGDLVISSGSKLDGDGAGGNLLLNSGASDGGTAGNIVLRPGLGATVDENGKVQIALDNAGDRILEFATDSSNYLYVGPVNASYLMIHGWDSPDGTNGSIAEFRGGDSVSGFGGAAIVRGGAGESEDQRGGSAMLLGGSAFVGFQPGGAVLAQGGDDSTGAGGGVAINTGIGSVTTGDITFLRGNANAGSFTAGYFNVFTDLAFGAAGTQYRINFGTVNTTDATVTTLLSFATVSDRSYMLEARVTARRTGGTAGTANDAAYYLIRCRVKNSGGTVTLIDVLSEESEDQAGWDADLDVSSANVRVRVTGAVDNNITWNVTLITNQV